MAEKRCSGRTVKNPSCPSCREESGAILERSIVEAGLEVLFECENCGHNWSVTF